MGYNQTRIANDGSGVISQQGQYRCYQHTNRLIMLARPHLDFLNGKQQEIESLQCTAALFNYQLPAPTWEIYVDDAKIDALPAVARFGQVITVRDGVSYLAIRPLPATDLGRDTEISLEPGVPQEPAHHGNVNIQPALLINAYLYNRNEVITPELLQQAKTAQAGFMVEMGDEKEYGSFERFRAHVRGSRLAVGDNGAVTCTSGEDTLAASWDSFTVNGRDPYAYAKEQQLWQDTTLTQMGRARLEKSGAVIERKPSWANMFLQTFPKQKIYVAMNLLPNYLEYCFREPGGVVIRADGACSMGRWAVKDSKEIDIKYHAFGGEYAPQENDPTPARVLFITGAKGKPQVTLNGKAAALKPWKDGWLVSLTGNFPKDDEIAARLGNAQ
jgi:hypothetical protein